ncbi:putative DNA-binding transcriptional regulator YafY [Mobilisporobacter senegalensis]|uniref:Putative DNA-binding transcriptional regulator YafY n=1 Tax=Mobilisporobacter senegalensis TaxID=1329262 RepID=A0A3N1XJQ6_9FIRM|nr:YafY family protein [Mobilisporobacter senegalensis]ROR26328.1 putative DNA-binding transcriptional regulator YafY [Mobilisporobacter senegalensis]
MILSTYLFVAVPQDRLRYAVGVNMDKIERLISIVMILLQKDIVSAKVLSNLFSVSKRTILRDMETLSYTNIPIYSINGVNGGYGIMDEYKLDKRLLSSNDLQNILTALSGLEQILVSNEVETTINKIQSMVNSNSIENTIQLSFYDWSGRAEILQICYKCQEAIMNNKLVSFSYIDKNGSETNRIVEPYQLHFSEMSWYLKGYCLDRMSYRTFKLSRTDKLSIDKKSFIPRDYLAYQESEKRHSVQNVTVKALISPSIKDHFIERYGRMSVEYYSPESYLATICVPEDDIGYQFIAGFGTNLEIIEPKSYAENFLHFLSKIVEKYDLQYKK